MFQPRELPLGEGHDDPPSSARPIGGNVGDHHTALLCRGHVSLAARPAAERASDLTGADSLDLDGIHRPGSGDQTMVEAGYAAGSSELGDLADARV